MSLFDQWPYTNFHELNLEWMLRKIMELNATVKNFVRLESIKYADPIQWNITSQYEKNTIVVDPQTGTAYISVAPVPSGVALSNPDYWTVIFDLDIAQANNNITLRDDQNNVQATFDSVIGDWLLWNGTLYRVIRNIDITDAYLVGYNLERYTVELFIKDYINELNTIIGALDDLTTTDKDSIVGAINEVHALITTMIGDLDDLNTSDKDNIVDAINSALTDLTTMIGDLDNLLTADTTDIVSAINSIITTTIGALSGLNTTDKTSVVNAINEVNNKTIYYNVKAYGAKGDGVTDDTQAFIDAIADARANHGVVFVPATSSFYLITSVLTLGTHSHILGEGQPEIHFTSAKLFSISNFYGSIQNLYIVGNNSNSAVYFNLDNAVTYYWRFKHLWIKNVVHAFYDDVTSSSYIVDCFFEDINCTSTYGTSFVSNRSRGFITIRNFRIDHTSNLRDVAWHSFYMAGFVGAELEAVDVVGPVTRGSYEVTSFMNYWAFYFDGNADGRSSLWLSRVLVDTAPMNGFTFSNIRFINANNIETFGIAGAGFNIVSCEKSNFNNVFHSGGSGVSYAPANTNGMSIVNCTQLNFTNVISQLSTGSGIGIANSTSIIFNGLVCIANEKYGVVEDGVSTNKIIISGGNLVSNLVAQILQVGAASALSAVAIGSTLVASQVGVYTA